MTLVLGRKLEQCLVITTGAGEEITIRVVEIRPGRVSLGIDAPAQVGIMRAELRRTPNGKTENG